MNINEIICCVCDKIDTRYNAFMINKWRFAPNRMGSYTCSPECDKVITDLDDQKKKEKKIKNNNLKVVDK